MKTADPLGVRALVTARMTLTEFARAMKTTSGVVNHWIERGIPGQRVFRAVDVLGVPAEELRQFTSEAIKPPADFEAEFRSFSATFKTLEPAQKDRIIAAMQRMNPKP